MNPHYRSLKTRIIVNFSTVILAGLFLSVIVGSRMIGKTIINQAQAKVRLDLNSAREVYQEEMSTIKHTVRLTALRFFLKDSIKSSNKEQLLSELQKIREEESLDILNLTDQNGNVLLRTVNPEQFGDKLNREVINWVITHKSAAVSTQIVNNHDLEKEGKYFAEKAKIEVIPTPLADLKNPEQPKKETHGMMLSTAAPVFDYNGKLIGILCGEKLINRRFEIVDKVKNIVYRGQKHNGKDIGTVTIFQGGLRISTNVTTADGKRAIGTLVSREVYDQVIKKGIPWSDRAFVVNDWYITAYEPIKNMAGKIIGMLYVGILEAPYIELRNPVVLNFMGVAVITLILLVCIAFFTAIKTVKPLKILMNATKKIAKGELSYRVNIESRDEIGQLGDSFNHMAIDLEKVTQKYQSLNRTLEDRIKEKTRELEEAHVQLIQSEKLSSLGRMAAGVAHEINNPLTSILINAHLLSEEIINQGNTPEYLKIIIDETTRCSQIVKDLLHFSRQTESSKTPADINEVIDKTISLLKNQIVLNKVKINKNLASPLPDIIMDTNKIGQVFTNIILNAMDAMPKGGEINITSKMASNDNYSYLEITFHDNGCGISRQNLGKLFDPFFTTKGTKGTGLGLSVSYGILQQHGGDIDIQSEEGVGTNVTIILPVKR